MQDPGITYRFLQRLMEVVGDGDEDAQGGAQAQQAASDSDAPAEERSEQQQEAPTASSGWSVTVSMCEVYNDEIRDLLAKDPAASGSNTLEIRRDAEGGLVVRRPCHAWVRGVAARRHRPIDSPDAPAHPPPIKQQTSCRAWWRCPCGPWRRPWRASTSASGSARWRPPRSTSTPRARTPSSWSRPATRRPASPLGASSSATWRAANASRRAASRARSCARPSTSTGALRCGKDGAGGPDPARTGPCMLNHPSTPPHMQHRSLSALGDVMEALDKKQTHIPYRNSKLTHLLAVRFCVVMTLIRH